MKFPHETVVKPQISQFKGPLLHTFLLASTTYIVLQTVWMNLEYSEKRAELEAESKSLEDKIQRLVDAKKHEFDGRNRTWWFWK